MFRRFNISSRICKRYLSSDKQPPRFEGGERNFWQSATPSDPNKPVKRSGNLFIKLFLAFSVTTYLMPFGTAYVMDTKPEEFHKKIDADVARYRKASDEVAVKSNQPRMTDEQAKAIKDRSIKFYDSYVSILRTLGITTKKEPAESVWDLNLSEGSDNSGNSGFSEFPTDEFQDQFKGNNDFGGNNDSFPANDKDSFGNDKENNRKWS